MGHITKVTVIQLLTFAGLVVFGLVASSLWGGEQLRRMDEADQRRREGAAQAQAKRAQRMTVANNPATNRVATNRVARPLSPKEQEYARRAREALGLNEP